MNDNEAEQLSERAYAQLLSLAQDAAGLKACLKRIPDSLKAGALSAAIAQKYAELGLYDKAVAWVNQYYPHNHRADLLSVFVRIRPAKSH